MLCIKNGLIHDAIKEEPFQADLFIDSGKIVRIGNGFDLPKGTEVLDAEGLEIYPGFVEAHCHLGLDGYGIGFEGQDYNEMNDILSPQLRGIDSFNPMDPFRKNGGGSRCNLRCDRSGKFQCAGRNLYRRKNCRKTCG